MSSFYRGSHGVLIIYDITHKNSLYKLDAWMKDIEKVISFSFKMLIYFQLHKNVKIIQMRHILVFNINYFFNLCDTYNICRHLLKIW